MIPEDVWSFIKTWEGGDTFTDDPLDPGRATKWGISQANNPDVDVRNLTELDAQLIYEKRYWEAAHCHELSEWMQLIHFNCAVNCGVSTAVKCLQRTIGSKPDGIFGKFTKDKVNNYFGEKKFTVNYLGWQFIHYFRIVERRGSQFKWLRGWSNRTLSAAWQTAVRYGKR